MKKTLALMVAMGTRRHRPGSPRPDVSSTHQALETEATLKLPKAASMPKRKCCTSPTSTVQSWEADGKGSIAKVGLDGKVIAADGHGAQLPERARTLGRRKWLYAATPAASCVIDVKKGKSRTRSRSPKACSSTTSLRTGKGTLYVSDSKGKKVFVVKDGKAHVYSTRRCSRAPTGC